MVLMIQLIRDKRRYNCCSSAGIVPLSVNSRHFDIYRILSAIECEDAVRAHNSEMLTLEEPVSAANLVMNMFE